MHNGLVDKRPSIIARCHGTADIVDAVKMARELNLEIAVRGTIDGGVMIDLAPMKGMHVDPVARTARAQGGVLWKELNRETQLHGLAVTGGVVGTTGIAGPPTSIWKMGSRTTFRCGVCAPATSTTSSWPGAA